MDAADRQRRVSGSYMSSNAFSTSIAGTSHRASSSALRHRNQSSSFIHDSYNASLDFPTYIPWQTLSTDVMTELRQGSVKINRSNKIEWADTIKEETPLLDRRKLASGSQGSEESNVSDAVSGGISWKVAAFLLVNAALGAGVLNYPAAYDRIGGVWTATALQLILMVVLASTMFILVYSADLNKDTTYHDVLLSLCGKRCQQLSAISILLTCYGICITFLIIIGDQYDRIFVSLLDECVWYVDRRFTITITALATIFPMCYFQRLDFLKYAGTLGVFAMLYVVFLNVYEYYVIENGPVQVVSGLFPVSENGPVQVVSGLFPVSENGSGQVSSGPVPVPSVSSITSSLAVIAVIPVITFAYQCHEIVVPVYACMSDRSMKTFGKTTALALGLLFTLYCTAGTFGFLTFGSRVSPDIMQMYDANDPFVLIGITALVIKMITTYPPMIVCGRGALDGLYAEFMKLSAEEFIQGELRRRIVITTIWFFTSLAIAVFTPNIGIVIELLGSLASANVFIFPSMCLIAITRRPDHKLSRMRRNIVYVVAALLIAMGLVMFTIVMIQVVDDFARSSEDVKHEVLCK